MSELNSKRLFEERNNDGQGSHRFSKRAKALIIIILIVTPVSLGIFWYYFWGPGAVQKPSQSQMVPMSDGIRLATDVYLPAGEGPFPVILYRTPYDKDTDPGPIWALQYGIAIVSQDHRGCHASEGTYTAFGSDGQDAYDTLVWMKTQSWFNGLLGTEGGSARGITQYRQVPNLDDLLCQKIEVATPDLFHHAMVQGGAPRKMLAQGWLASVDQGSYYEEVFLQPGNTLSTSAFARDHMLQEYDWSNVTWPSLHMGGWYDCFSQGIVEGFMGYQYKGGTGGAGQAHMVMGPWTHSLSRRDQGDLQYPENAASDPYSQKIFEAMFAEALLGRTDVGDHRTMPVVTYYVMGDVGTKSQAWNRWATSDVWPVPYANQTWYLQPDNTLSQSIPATAKNFSYVFNPANPLQTRGGQNLNRAQAGPYDQRKVESGRIGLVVFESAVSSSYLLTGRIWAHLFVKSDRVDTDFVVKLEDVYPDGRAMLLCDGIIRMRSREGQDKEVLMDGSGITPYEAWVDLWTTSYVFNAGHTIRIVISSSNYPRFDINPNTGATIEPVSPTTPMLNATNAILTSSNYPSSIIFPVPSAQPVFVEGY